MKRYRPSYAPRPLDQPTAVPLHPEDDLTVLDEAKTLAAPDDPRSWATWRDRLARWRADARQRLAYDGERYEATPPAPFVLAMTNLWDGALYDHGRGAFTVDRYLDQAERSFGGFDGVLLWHAYPVLGIDGRGPLDYFRELPDLPAIVRGFHERGVQVYLSHYPWAESDEAGALDDLAACVARVGADGVFLDSVKEGSAGLRQALDGISPALLIGGESRVPLARIEDHQMSWAQWFADSPVPGVLKSKWFERRHMLHHTRRWHRSHVDELHSAWLNGSGVLVWENVFGVWVGWSRRDRALLRRMRPVQRSWRAWLCSEHWTPLADHAGNGACVYASRWDHDGIPLWTVVNKGDAVDGSWIVADAQPGRQWVELTSGQALSVEPLRSGAVAVGGALPADGIAAVAAVPPPRATKTECTPPDEPGELDASVPERIAIRTPAPTAMVAQVPNDMTHGPVGRVELRVTFRLRETGLYDEAPFVDEWKPALGARLHVPCEAVRTTTLHPFAIDRFEVTNRAFATFLADTGYAPARPDRFLAHWSGGAPSPGSADEAVTNVDLDDARAYAAWLGRRLPTEDEWQAAGEAGGFERRIPRVWNLTESEHDDGRTRFLILKGGSDLAATGSEWYFDGGPRPPSFSAKLIRLGGGLSRSPRVGFRCAVDLPSQA